MLDFTSNVEKMATIPSWAGGLEKFGSYYRGYVDDLDATLELHRRETVTTWAIRRSETKRTPHFLCDFSDAEFSALQLAFPSTTVYGCDFHREQAWTRWVKDRKNALAQQDADCLLDLLRACAWAPPGSGSSPIDVNYLQGVNALKQSAVWKKNVHVQKWLSSKWLSHPQVCSCGLQCVHATIATFPFLPITEVGSCIQG
jgi:hypothetical protein